MSNKPVQRLRATRVFPRGFTLVEVLMVVVILGIASAIIVPQIASRDDMKAAAAARTVVADLIYAQNLAISTGTTVYIKFNTASNNYTLLSTASSTGDVALNNPITQTTYTQQFGSTVRGWESVSIYSAAFNGVDSAFRPEFTLAFDEIGAPYVFCYDVNQTNDLNDGSIVIHAGTFANTITISPATGEISVN